MADYEFDGLNRRIEKTLYDATGQTVASTTDYFYNEQWQVLEEKFTPAAGAAVLTDYVWDLAYIDSPVARFRDENGDGDCGEFGETLYYTTDANHNVTALVDGYNGDVVERCV